jgi:8-oxo-dGTP diphosphatase
LSCFVQPGSAAFLGTFTAPAANETGCLVEAALYRLKLVGTITAASEIEEIVWLDPHKRGSGVAKQTLADDRRLFTD